MKQSGNSTLGFPTTRAAQCQTMSQSGPARCFRGKRADLTCAGMHASAHPEAPSTASRTRTIYSITRLTHPIV